MNEIKIWGIIQSEQGDALPYACVRLLKKTQRNRRNYYEEVDECYSDEQGRYAFFIEEEDPCIYKVIVLLSCE